jgi:membrane-bound lytic murein transglycosylase D
LNPAFNRPVIVGAGSTNILLPADRAEVFQGNLAAWESTGQPLASWTTYTLAPGETLEKVARRVGVGEPQLREANRVLPRYRLAAGSTILIPRDETMEVDIAPEKLQASFALVPEFGNLRQVTYRVRRGDTLGAVARRWNVQPDDIVAWNRLANRNLFAGQRLSLTVVRAPAKPKASSRTVVANAAVRAAAQAAARR